MSSSCWYSYAPVCSSNSRAVTIYVSETAISHLAPMQLEDGH